MKKGNLPASPTVYQDAWDSTLKTEHYGLTKREHFAGLAMQGYIRDISVPQSACISKVVNLSVAFADALLKELDK